LPTNAADSWAIPGFVEPGARRNEKAPESKGEAKLETAG